MGVLKKKKKVVLHLLSLSLSLVLGNRHHQPTATVFDKRKTTGAVESSVESPKPPNSPVRIRRLVVCARARVPVPYSLCVVPCLNQVMNVTLLIQRSMPLGILESLDGFYSFIHFLFHNRVHFIY